MLRSLFIYSIALIAALLLLPEAKAEVPAAVSIETSSGSFVPGEQSSCVDLSEAKVSKTKAKTSVQAQGFAFPSFIVHVNSTDRLNVDTIRAVASDATGNRAVLEIPADEVVFLLGHEAASVQGPITVDSNDSARNADPKFAPCSLSFGGINWLNSSLELNVVVSLLGTVENEKGDLTPVEVSFETAIVP